MKKRLMFNNKKIRFQLSPPLLSKKKQPPQEVENPWFYCSLCSTFHSFTDLIDGCSCPVCEKELFLIPWFEVEKHLIDTSHMFRHGFWKPKRRKSWVG